jgi:hypothetical protein
MSPECCHQPLANWFIQGESPRSRSNLTVSLTYTIMANNRRLVENGCQADDPRITLSNARRRRSDPELVTAAGVSRPTVGRVAMLVLRART